MTDINALPLGLIGLIGVFVVGMVGTVIILLSPPPEPK
jgi:hypothetical protein